MSVPVNEIAAGIEIGALLAAAGTVTATKDAAASESFFAADDFTGANFASTFDGAADCATGGLTSGSNSEANDGDAALALGGWWQQLRQSGRFAIIRGLSQHGIEVATQ